MTRLQCVKAQFLAVSLCLVAGIGLTADVAYFGIIKSQEYVQTSPGTPVARATNGFAFNALLLASTNNVVTNVTVKPGNGALRNLVTTNSDQTVWLYEERFDTQASLDAAYPYGSFISPVNYGFTMATKHEGVKTVNLNYSLLTFIGGQPAVPQITNFAAAQWIDHTLDFRLHFVPSGSALLDLVQLVVLDATSNVVFTSPAPFSTGALTGASNSVVIPHHVLPPGQTLTGHLAYVRPAFLETNAYVGAIGVPAVLRDTEFPLTTRPSPDAPRLELLSTAPSTLHFTGETNRQYVLQASGDLTNWVDLRVTNTTTTSAILTDPTATGPPMRLYRLRVGQ